MVDLSVVVGGVLVAVGVFLALPAGDEGARLARRVRPGERPPVSPAPAGLVLRRPTGKVRAVGLVDRLRAEAAAANLSVRTVVLLRGLGAGAGLLGGVLLHLPPPLLPVTAGLGLGLVGVALARRRGNRLRLAEEQLPAALELLASALRAGLGVQAALEAAARETPPPLGEELRRLLGEIRLGTPFAQAAEALTERLPGREVRALVVALEVQRETGGPLAGVLETVAETLRARARLRGQVQALTAEVRLSALVLGLLPAALLLVLWTLSPGYIRPFVEAPAGQLLLLGAAGLQGLGFLLMRRLGEIDV